MSYPFSPDDLRPSGQRGVPPGNRVRMQELNAWPGRLWLALAVTAVTVVALGLVILS